MGHSTDGCHTLRDVIQNMIGEGGSIVFVQGAVSVPLPASVHLVLLGHPSSRCASSEDGGTSEIDPSALALAGTTSSPINPLGRVGLSLAPAPLAFLSPRSPLAPSVSPLMPSLGASSIELVHHVATARHGLQLGQRRPRRAECDYTPLAEPLSVIFP